ncbi:LysR family transcriptional regulator [Enterococcus sp. ZJ1668]|uniref:LysR family transcriptional regulator n=1 Tax=Enterococcus sp. ZJ1668 TaxID=2709402 RepID=UPI0013EDE515|nr:LysR family transcriptional regulator [Enterococcus sp. ZJ1668]
MDIHKFEVFLDLAETLNFTKTAERQFTTQGNVSKQILSLETELDIKLFERSHRKIELTEVGSLLLPYVKNVVEQYHSMQGVLEAYTNENNLSLNILTIPTMINYDGFAKITEFLKLHPEFTVQLKEVESVELTYDEPNGHSDTIHFARSFQAPQKSIEWLPTEKDYFAAVLPKRHPLATKPRLQLEELQNENFLVLGPSTNLYQPVLELCHEAGFEPKISYKGSRIDLIINMIANDMGVAIVMEKTVKNLLKENTVLVPITPTRESYLAFTRRIGEHSLASDAFWAYLKKDNTEN